MNILQRILGGEKKEKAFAEAMIRAFNAGTRVNTLAEAVSRWMPPVYIYDGVEKAFTDAIKDAIFYSVTDRIADKFGHIPRYVYREQKAARKWRKKALDENVADGELMQLLLNPNDLQGQDEFFYLCCLSYITTGECFIWKNRGGIEGGKPLELYVIPPWCVQINPGEHMFQRAGYEITVGAKTIKGISPDDMIVWSKPQLALDQNGAHLRGYSPMRSQTRVLTQAGSITDASVNMYKSGGARGALVNEGLDNISDDQMDRIKSVVNNKINGTDAKGTIAAIQGAWKYYNFGLSSVDMDLLDADDAITKKICFSLGFPAELYQSDSTFANKEQAWHFFITNTLMPMTARFDGALTKGLIKDFGERGAYIASDYSDLPEMQVMSVKLVEAATKAWWKTPDERRIMTFDEPLETPEMQKVYMPSGFTPIDEMSLGEPLPPEEEEF